MSQGGRYLRLSGGCAHLPTDRTCCRGGPLTYWPLPALLLRASCRRTEYEAVISQGPVGPEQLGKETHRRCAGEQNRSRLY